MTRVKPRLGQSHFLIGQKGYRNGAIKSSDWSNDAKRRLKGSQLGFLNGQKTQHLEKINLVISPAGRVAKERQKTKERETGKEQRKRNLGIKEKKNKVRKKERKEERKKERQKERKKEQREQE